MKPAREVSSAFAWIDDCAFNELPPDSTSRSRASVLALCRPWLARGRLL